MKRISLFIFDNIIGLKWINDVVGYFLKLIGVDINTPFGGTLQFFIYD